jgi:hypothetical protein
MGEGFKPVDIVYDSLSYIKGSGWVFLLNVLNDAYDLVGRLGSPANTHHDRKSRLMRFFTSSCSMSSPRSAAAMPFCTPAIKRA